jgi:hypothetical protein
MAGIMRQIRHLCKDIRRVRGGLNRGFREEESAHRSGNAGVENGT